MAEELRVTPRGEAFVLEEHVNWFCDGTFNVAPLGYPLFTIYALINNNRMIPFIHTLTKNKSEVTYNRILGLLELQMPGLAPETVTINFEMAA